MRLTLSLHMCYCLYVLYWDKLSQNVFHNWKVIWRPFPQMRRNITRLTFYWEKLHFIVNCVCAKLTYDKLRSHFGGTAANVFNENNTLTHVWVVSLHSIIIIICDGLNLISATQRNIITLSLLYINSKHVIFETRKRRSLCTWKASTHLLNGNFAN